MNKMDLKIKRLYLNRILKSMFLFAYMLYVSAVSASYDYLLWGKNGYNSSGQFDYSGGVIDSITGNVESMYTGTLYVLYKECTLSGIVSVYYRVEDRWLFIPKTLSINGQSFAISIYTVPSGYTLTNYNDNYYMLKEKGSIYASRESRRCSYYEVGGTHPMDYTYPSFSLQLDISALSVGNYSGSIPIKIAYGEHFGVKSSDITELSDSLAFQYSSDTDVPYTISIANKCTISPESLSLTHGSLPMGSAEGNTVSETVTVNCSVAASMVVTFQSRNIPDPVTSYSDGVGVDLGNGWVSEVTIGDSGLSDVSFTDKTISVPVGGLSLPVSSTLRKNGTVTSGNLSGSLVISLELK